MSKLVKDLPKEIQDLWVKRAKEQGNSGVIYETTPVWLGFDWEKTIEGHIFWSKINEGNYEPFYELYPQQPTTTYPLLKVKSVQIQKDSEVLECYQNLENVELVYSNNWETLIVKV